MRHTLAVLGSVVACLSLAPAPGAAQWRLGVDLTATRYGGSTRDSTADPGPAIQPGAAVMTGVRLDRTMNRWRLGLRMAYGKTGLRAFIEEFALTEKTVGDLLEADLLLGYRVGGIGPSGAVWLELGPALPLWDDGSGFRERFAAVAAGEYAWDVAGRWSGAIRAELMASNSWFQARDLPAELEPIMTRRYGVSLGLRYRL